MNDFVTWFNRELESRSWTYADVARRGGISKSTISKVLSAQSQPGPDFCLAVARAFRLSPENVFRKAGILPPLPGPENDRTLHELSEIVKHLTPDQRRDILEYARWRYQQQHQEE